MQRAQSPLIPRGTALRLHVRGRVSPAHDLEGPQPRHRVVLDARYRMAGPQGLVRALARPGEFRREGAAENESWRSQRGVGCSSHPTHPKERMAMPGRLKDKVALVTAAGQGIGGPIAQAFIAEGAVVIATDLDETKLGDLNAKKRVKLDVRSADAVAAMAALVRQELGSLDVLANVAGYVHHGTVLDCADADWDFSFDLNVKSMHRTIKAFLPDMLARKRGAIVNMSSAVSSLRGVPDRYVYGATKAAVIGLTKAVAADFIRQGIRCNAICPGTIESPSLEERIERQSAASGKSRQEVEAAFVARQPMGRLGKAQEVAALAVFLVSDESSYITGQAHLVDGGMAL